MRRGTDWDEDLRTLFIPTVNGFIVRYGKFLVLFDIRRVYDQALECLGLPAVADGFWPERIKVPNHVFENNMVGMDWSIYSCINLSPAFFT